MALNMMGLGFSFGAKDDGLIGALDGISDRLGGIQNSLVQMTDLAAQSTIPFEALGDQLSTAEFEKVGDELAGVANVMGTELPDAAKRGGTDFGRSAGQMTSKGFGVTAMFGFMGGAAGGALGILNDMVGSVVGLVKSLNPLEMFSFDKFRSGLSGLTSGINLTSSLEGEMTQLSVSARQLGANMGYTGSQLDRFTSQAAGMAHGLNIGPEEAARAIRGFTEAESEMRAIGVESAQDLARFTAGFGVNADLIRNSTMQMRREFGFNDEQIAQTMSSIVAFGQASGDVSGAMGELPELMNQTRRRAALMGMELDSQELADYAVQTQGLGAALFAMGQDSDAVRSSMNEISSAMIESETQFQNMFSGTQEDLPDFVRSMAIATGDVQGTFDLMQQGPSGFITSMAQMVKSAGGSANLTSQQFDFIRSHISEALGPERGAEISNFFRTASDEALNSVAAVETATRSLGDLGREAHRTGRTLQDSLDLALQSAEASFRSLARADASQFVRDTSRHMKELGRNLKDVAGGDGPMASLVRQMSLADSIGSLAFIPEGLRGTAMVANQAAEQMGEFAASFTSLGGIMGTVRNGIALFGTRTAEVYAQMREEAERTARVSGEAAESQEETLSNALDATAAEFATYAEEFIDTAEHFVTGAVEAFASMDWGAALGADDESKGIGGAIRRVFNKLADVDWTEIWNKLKTGMDKLVEFAGPWIAEKWTDFKKIMNEEGKKAFEAIPWDDMWKGLLDTGAKIKEKIIPILAEIGGDIWEGIKKGFWASLPAVAEGLAIATLVLLVAIPAAIAVGLMIMIAKFLVNIGLAVAELAAIWWDGMVDIKDWFKRGWKEFSAVWSDGVIVLGEHWDDFIEEFKEVWSAGMKVLGEKWDALVEGIKNKINSLKTRFVSLWNAASEGFDRFSVWIKSKTSELLEGISALWSGSVQFITDLWDGMGSGIDSALESIKETFRPFFDWLSEKWTAISDIATGIWESVSEAASDTFASLIEDIEPLREAWGKVAEFFADAWEGVTGAIERIFTKIGEIFEDMGDGAIEAMTGIMTAIIGLFGNSANTVIAEDMELSAREFERMESRGVGSIDRVMDRFNDQFGNSAHDAVAIVSDDLQGTARAIGDLAEARVSARGAEESLPQIRAQRVGQMTAELSAIHYPDWYMRDYRGQFTQKMDQLIAAVNTGTAVASTASRGGGEVPGGRRAGPRLSGTRIPAGGRNGTRM